jgi:hypothetical protein
MLSKKNIETINKLIENKIFTFNDELIPNQVGLSANFDYKIKLLGYKKMISVGEWYNYLMVSVEFVRFNNTMSKSILPSLVDKTTDDSFLYFFKRKLKNEISVFLSVFDDVGRYIIIDSYKLSDNINTLVTEQRMSRIAIRTVVRDVISKIKNKKSGFFNLPGDDEVYSFTNLPFQFDVELTLRINNNLDLFMVNGYYVPDEDVVEILVVFNPDKIEKQLYDLIGELNELVAHELEHARQEYEGEFNLSDDYEEPEDPLSYYTQPNEIAAQYRGFKRLSKLSKKPLDVIAKMWFEKNKEIHNLSDYEIKIVMDKILNYGQKKY